MSHTTLNRLGTWMLKKTKSIMAGSIVEGDSSAEGEVPVTSDNYLVATLPRNCVVTNAYVVVKTVSDATTATIKVGTTEGGVDILPAVTLKTAGKVGVFAGGFDTGTGVDIYFALTYTGAPTAVGDYVLVVEYDEYTKNNGEYTDDSAV